MLTLGYVLGSGTNSYSLCLPALISLIALTMCCSSGVTFLAQIDFAAEDQLDGRVEEFQS